jgi:hypothetical protein
LLALLFDPEVGGDMLLRNVGYLSPNSTASCPRRYKSSVTAVRMMGYLNKPFLLLCKL